MGARQVGLAPNHLQGRGEEKMRYLTVNEVAEINRREAEGSDILSFPMLESAVARPRHSAFGEDAYPDIFQKAGALMHSLASNHCFVNGNKRTALIATVVFLGLNGFIVEAEQGDMVDLVLRAAQNQADADDIAATLKQWVTELPVIETDEDEN